MSKVYESSANILFTQFIDGLSGKKWKSWSPRHLEITSEGVLQYRVNKDTVIKRKLDIKSVSLTYIPVDIGGGHEAGLSEIGFQGDCLEDGMFTSFRCIFPEDEFLKFCDAIKQVSKENNVNDFINECKKHGKLKDTGGIRPVVNTANASGALAPRPVLAKRASVSNMRRSIAYQMDLKSKQSMYNSIMTKRGAFKWLPVAYQSDLLHGSWWYTYGSFFTVISAIIIIIFDHSPDTKSLKYKTEDDSAALPTTSYEGTWALMAISGVFFTLGSMAFLRAVSDPPLRPLIDWVLQAPNTTKSVNPWANRIFKACCLPFSCYLSEEQLRYHLGSDELLGSWMFLLACVPFIPFSFLYIAADVTNVFYYILLGGACLSFFGAYIFLANCYPSDEHGAQWIVPLLKKYKWMCCCCCWCMSDADFNFHYANDWLAGTWIIYYLTLYGTAATFMMVIYSIATKVYINIFINGCTFVDCLMFLIGSMYFVSGSYPEHHEDASVTPMSRANKRNELFAGGDVEKGNHSPVSPVSKQDSSSTLQQPLVVANSSK